MANVNTKAKVLLRDGFRCRYCARPVLLSQAVKVLDMHAGTVLWDAHGRHPLLRHRWATVDHVLPAEIGGTDELENLAACCVRCNSAKALADSREALRPVGSGTAQDGGGRVWDGLSSLFLHMAGAYADRLTKEDRRWRFALEFFGVRALEGDEAARCLEAVVGVLRIGGGAEGGESDEMRTAAFDERLLTVACGG